jgi:dynein light chain roadblock-type
MQAAQTT